MKNKFPLAIACLVLLLVAVGTLAVWLVRETLADRPKSVVLPDGTEVVILGATVGDAPFTLQKPWQRFARKLLPAPMKGWLPDESFTSGWGGSNMLRVWYQLKGPGGSGAPPREPWTWYTAAGKNGFRYPVGSGSGGTSLGGVQVSHVELEAFPRRQKDFELQFLARNLRVMGSIRIRNPIRGPFVEWQPKPMPMTQTGGPLTVTLESITEFTNRTWPGVNPKWTLESTDSRWRRADPGYSPFADATGNSGPFLSFDEPAWKLIMPFRRPNAEDFEPEEKFSITNLAIPGPGSLQEMDIPFERLGLQFKVLYLAGAGSLVITNGTNRVILPPQTGSPSSGWTSWESGGTRVETWGSDQPYFMIETPTMGPYDEIRYRLTGSDGKQIKMQSSGAYGRGAGRWVSQQRFKPPDGVSTVSLEVIISRAILFEFVVNPAEVHRVNQSGK